MRMVWLKREVCLPVADRQAGVRQRHETIIGTLPAPPSPEAVGEVTEKGRALLADIAAHPIAGVTARYERLGWNAKIGNAVKDAIFASGPAEFENVATSTARIQDTNAHRRRHHRPVVA